MQDLEKGDFTFTEQKATKSDREALIRGHQQPKGLFGI